MVTLAALMEWFRKQAASFPILTKMLPGLVGVLGFVCYCFCLEVQTNLKTEVGRILVEIEWFELDARKVAELCNP